MRLLLSAAAIPVLVLVTGCSARAEPEPEPEPLAPWAWEMPRCVAYLPERYETPARRVQASSTAGVTTEVYEPGWGPEAFAEVRAVVRTCGSFEDGDLREQNIVVRTGFDGDDSMLVETVRIAPPAPMQTSYAAVVRDGDAIVTFRIPGLSRQETLCRARAEHATCGSART